MDPVVAAQPDPPPADDRAARLEEDLAAAIEQQRATSDVLEAIGRATFELAPVFETVLRHAVHLCDADAGQVWELDGDVYRMATALGGREDYRRFLRAHPIARGPGTVVGRVGLERRTVQ